jgi:hypothetical protein
VLAGSFPLQLCMPLLKSIFAKQNEFSTRWRQLGCADEDAPGQSNCSKKKLIVLGKEE